MSIKFTIKKNHLNTQTDSPYIPRTVVNTTVSREKTMELMAYRSTVTPGDINAVMETLEYIVTEQLAGGNAVDLGFIRLRPSIKGSFSSTGDAYRSSKQSIDIKLKAGRDFKLAVERKAKVEMVDLKTVAARIGGFNNFNDPDRKNAARPGDFCSVNGRCLTFDSENEIHGIYLENTESGEEVRIKGYGRKSDRVIDFTLPENIKNGSYRLFLKTGVLSNDLVTVVYPVTIFIGEPEPAMENEAA